MESVIPLCPSPFADGPPPRSRRLTLLGGCSDTPSWKIPSAEDSFCRRQLHQDDLLLSQVVASQLENEVAGFLITEVTAVTHARTPMFVWPMTVHMP